MTNAYLAQRLPDELPGDPMHWAAAWLEEAVDRDVQRNPTAMTLVTVDAAGQPSSRVVLCKSFLARDLGVPISADMQSIESDIHPAILRPPHWGGVRVWARSIELWIEGSDRIHERGRWLRSLTQDSEHAFTAGDWHGTRLQP